MNPLLQHLFGPASPGMDRGRLCIEGRTAKDDLEEFAAGGNVATEDDLEGTLLGDVQDVDLKAGYHDEPPEDFRDEDEATPDTSNWQKRYSDTREALGQKNTENATLKAQLEALQRERFQPAQPNILQPAQNGIDPLAAVEQDYEAAKKQTTQYYMDKIKSVNRQDPNVQSRVAELWAEHQEKLVELNGARQERKAQVQADLQASHHQGYQRQMNQALQVAGFDPQIPDHQEAFHDRVAILNRRMPGWDQGMSGPQTFEYVVTKMKEAGVLPQADASQRLTPYEQHQQRRQSGAGAVKAGTRTDPTKPQAKSPKEVPDKSFFAQLREDKQKRRVTPEVAMKIRQR